MPATTPTIPRSEPAAGYGMIKIKPKRGPKRARRLSDFDPAVTLAR